MDKKTIIALGFFVAFAIGTILCGYYMIDVGIFYDGPCEEKYRSAHPSFDTEDTCMHVVPEVHQRQVLVWNAIGMSVFGLISYLIWRKAYSLLREY